MKKLHTILLAAIFMVVSCERYEDIWEELRDHEQRILTCHNILQAMIFM